MKPFIKIGSFVMAVMMMLTAVIATGCTPITLNKEWSYRSGDNELAIGVYIYSLNLAYQQAQGYAEKLEEYDSTSDSWLNMEITDEDGDKEIASKWIKAEAETMCLNYLAVDAQLKELNIKISEGKLATADEAAKDYWEIGPYAGYVMPMRDQLEPYGISLESFQYATYEFNLKNTELFNALYKNGGSKAVSDTELEKYFTENYTDYSYFSVNLYESTTDQAGATKNVALAAADAKKLTDELDGYAKELNNGKAYSDVIKKYMTANKVESDPTTSNTEILKSSSMGDELKKAYEKLKDGEATTLKVGKDDSATYYILYKNDINSKVADYAKEGGAYRDSVLQSMKSEEFKDYVDELASKIKFEKNESVINMYDPKMFFIPQEPTTTADETTANG